MDTLILIILFCVIIYHIALSKGKKIGKKQGDELNYHVGYRKGIRMVEEEISELSRLNDKDIVERIKNLSEKYKNIK
jgi:hypothetical protein